MVRRSSLCLAALIPLTVACGPPHTHVERSATYTATLDDVYPLVADLKTFYEWSPWSKTDPNQTVEFSDPSSGMDAWYSWKGNEEVGSGKMTVIAEEKNKLVTHKLQFFEPWEGISESGFVLEEQGDKVKVTWNYDQDNEGFARIMINFMDMDEMLGPDYEKGLASLGEVVEKKVAERKAAEKKAEEEQKAREAEAAAATDADGTNDDDAAPSAGG